MAQRFEDEGNVAVEPKSKTKLEKPKLYKVLIHNDHYTTREFVVEILTGIFHHSEAEAVRIMMHVHRNGVGVAGVYSYDIATTKVQKVEILARKHEFPLHLSLEPES